MNRLPKNARENIAFTLLAIIVVLVQLTMWITSYPDPLWYISIAFNLGIAVAAIAVALALVRILAGNI